jgi:hypothetical protein
VTGLLSRPGDACTDPAELLDELLAIARRHCVFVALMTAGLALRALAQIAYRPALLSIDTMKYLYNAYPGSDPVGYKAPLKAILAFGGLPAVTAIQHLLGLGMAVTIYVMLLRRGTPRWLAAVATAPVLLDAYQIQIEQTIMPDVWFEALLLAGVAALLTADPSGRQAGNGQGGGVKRKVTSGLVAVTVAGLLLGATATFRQVGEILIVPALLCVLSLGGGWRAAVTRAAALTVAFAVPVLGYMAGSYVISGHFWLSRATPRLASYGRMATAADSLKLFAVTRTSSQEGTPISRWQFQTFYPTYGNWVMLDRHLTLVLGLRLTAGDPDITLHALDRRYGGRATVDKPIAAALRKYQLHGGYTPGPLMAVFAVAGLAGSLLALIRRPSGQGRGLALACLAFFAAGAAVLVVSDAFQFSWRCQLPALITLPPAGVATLTLAGGYLASRARAGASSGHEDAELA